MLNASILTWLTFVPAAGAIVVLLLPRRGRAPQIFSLVLTLCLFVLALHLPAHFNYRQHGFQFELNVPWVGTPAIRYHVGVDGLSMWLVVLVSFLAPLGVLISWRAIQDRTHEFYALLLLQQTAMYGVFIALDLILYYAFWELSIIPLALLIGMYGRKNGRGAAIKFFLYAFIPSALLLVAMLWLYGQTGTFDLVELQRQMHGWNNGAHSTGLWLASLAFLGAFAVKVPVFPLHGWLRDGISEAPTAVMMILAGKLGLYSLLRFHVGLFPAQAAHIAPLMVALAVIGILYGALMALVQTDLKRLAAYATLSAVSFIVLGIYAFTAASMDGAAYQILNESISASAFFMLLGILYERYGTYDMASLGGVATKMPRLSMLFVITALSLIGLPSLNVFVGEFLILSGSFHTHPNIVCAATVGVILSASYMLWMVQRVFYGQPSTGVAALSARDVNWRERAAIWPTIALMIAMGVVSVFWMRAIDLTVPGMAPAKASREALIKPVLALLTSCAKEDPVVLSAAKWSEGSRGFPAKREVLRVAQDDIIIRYRRMPTEPPALYHGSAPVLYQGTTSVVETSRQFGSNIKPALYQGTTSVVPQTAENPRGFSPWGTLYRLNQRPTVETATYATVASTRKLTQATTRATAGGMAQ